MHTYARDFSLLAAPHLSFVRPMVKLSVDLSLLRPSGRSIRRTFESELDDGSERVSELGEITQNDLGRKTQCGLDAA